MTTYKHNPVPWHRGEEHETKVEILDANGRRVATVHGSTAFGDLDMDGNARLILDAVEAVKDAALPWSPSPSPSSAPRAECDHARDDSYHCPKCWAAPASPQGERERALEGRIKEAIDHLQHAVSMVRWDDEGSVLINEDWVSWESVGRVALDYARNALRALAASSPHYAEKED